MFEAMGIKYMGPIDGHDLPGLINFLAEIKHVNKPVLLHIKTRKGQGYEVAAQEPTKFHSPAAFQVQGCRVELSKGSGKSWTAAFADAMVALAQRDKRVVALTAAMPDGTGLSKFEKELPGGSSTPASANRTSSRWRRACARAGCGRSCAVYSTFIQRAFDQVWQEVVLNKLPVVFCMDRAGYVGDDGAVHHGFMDQAFLRPMPDMVLMAPSDEAELNRALRLSLTLDTAAPRSATRATACRRATSKTSSTRRCNLRPVRSGPSARAGCCARDRRDDRRLWRAGAAGDARGRATGGGGFLDRLDRRSIL
jgi:1-deoxy-D-xylulose-5-phosphate synthase